MGDGPEANVKRARILVLLVPIVVLLIVGGVALAGSNIFQGFQSQSQVSGATTEGALARDIEREARVLDVIEVVIEDGGIFLWIVDLEADEPWSQRDADAVSRAFGVIFEYAKDQNLFVSIVFFRITSLMGTEGIPVDVFQGVVQFFCSVELVADYNSDADAVLNLCDLTPDDLFVAPTAEIPFLLGR